MESAKGRLPNPLSSRDLRNNGIEYNTSQTYPVEMLEKIIKHAEHLEDEISHKDVSKYYFEDLSYHLNQKDDSKFPFAPGYVEYTKKLLDVYSNIKDERSENKIYDALIDFLKGPNGKIKGISIKGNIFCKFCGYNHEARDFIRAILLHLLDGLEVYPRFVDFIHNEKIIDKNGYETLINLSTERQSTSPKKSSEQESAEEWFEKLSPLRKESVNHIITSEPEMTLEHLYQWLKTKKQKGEEHMTDYLYDLTILLSVESEEARKAKSKT